MNKTCLTRLKSWATPKICKSCGQAMKPTRKFHLCRAPVTKNRCVICGKKSCGKHQSLMYNCGGYDFGKVGKVMFCGNCWRYEFAAVDKYLNKFETKHE